jgi:site-specific DNA-cytosine methylase
VRTDQFQQVANAIPPALARAVLSAALGKPTVREDTAA